MTTNPMDERIRQQRLAALVKADAARARDSAVKQAFKDRAVDACDLIAGTAPDTDATAILERAIQTWPLERVVRSVPGIGLSRAIDVLVLLAVRPRKQFSTLTWEQRKRLADLCRSARDPRFA
jgi:hypothetical protein